MRATNRFNRIWYDGEPPGLWLRLLALLFRLLAAVRRGLYRIGLLPRTRVPVPVIVVGNLTVGGAGKTPLVVHLVEALRRHGFSPGVISRGYGGRPGREPLHVTADTPVALAGDEAVLIARRAGVPVCVHPKRARAAQALLQMASADVLICDDGLQHYALARDIEVAVIDGARGFGNGHLLPAGPLREPPKRLKKIDHVVVNGDTSPALTDRLEALVRQAPITMRLAPVALVNLVSGERRAPDALAGKQCVAIAGIGNPQRFFTALAELGYRAECRAFADHHMFRAADFMFAAGRPLLMTEKDAVKCDKFAGANWWYLETAAALDADLGALLANRLASAASVRESQPAENAL